MKITCTYENIKNALRDVESITARNISLPILENILIEAKEGIVFFSVTNLELGVIRKVKSKIETEGSIVISTTLLRGFLTALRGEAHITLIADGDELLCESGSYKTKIKGYDANEFPIIPQSVSLNKTSLVLAEFQDSIKSVLSFVTQNDIRPELTGVYMYTQEDQLVSVATDSFRLGERKKKQKDIILGGEAMSDLSMIVPQKLCSYLLKLQGESELLEFTVEDNHIFASYEDLTITARLIDGKYPDYHQIIPQKTETNTILKKVDFQEAMKVMMVFSDAQSSEANLSVAEDGVVIKTLGSGSGEGKTKINASIDGGDQDITINPRYILDGISQVALDDIYMGIINESSPIVFYGADESGVDKNYTYIVKPVKSSHK